MAPTVNELYGDFWSQPRPGFEARVTRSLAPRGYSLLMQVFRETGIDAGHTVLDIGCRDASLSVEIALAFHCRVLAIDPIPSHVEAAGRRIAEAALQERVTALRGSIEALPLKADSVDRIWCRDMLNHVDLRSALKDCFRVLRVGGAIVVFQTLATDLLEPREAARLYDALAIIPDNMSCERFEAEAQAQGFQILRKESQGSESREYSLESGGASFDPALLQLARMRRLEQELVQEYGRAYYEATNAATLWGIYQMLGKLFNYIHVLSKPH